jgi:hypothetical protein
MIKKRREITEDTFAASTLEPKSQAYDDNDADVKAAIDAFNRLNNAQKARHIDFLQSVFQDSAWARSKNANDAANLKSALDLTLEESGFTDEAKEKCAKLFFEAVEDKHSPLRARIVELVNEYSPSPFLPDEQLDVMVMLAERIDELETDIADVEGENEELWHEIQLNLKNNSSPTKERRPKRSTVEENMLEPDENNADALFNEQTKYFDPQMRQYLRAMGEDI